MHSNASSLSISYIGCHVCAETCIQCVAIAYSWVFIEGTFIKGESQPSVIQRGSVFIGF